MIFRNVTQAISSSSFSSASFSYFSSARSVCSKTTSTCASSKLFCFDIDGVIVRGKVALKSAIDSINYLQKNKVPFMFLTNGSPTTELKRSEFLTRILKLSEPIDPETMVMAQTPLKQLTKEHDKKWLFIGQGEVKEIASYIGFKNVITLEELRQTFKILDACDKKNEFHQALENGRNPLSEIEFSKIDGIVILDDPLHWESAYQLIVDLIVLEGDLTSNGGNYFEMVHRQQTMPIYLACTDYFWVAEAPYPRIAVGSFISGLEQIYSNVTGGKRLLYKKVFGKPNIYTYDYIDHLVKNHFKDREIKQVFFVGDNPLTDVYGANNFRNDLKEKQRADYSVHSLLVKTGVFNKDFIDPLDPSCNVKFLHNSTPQNKDFLFPDKIVNNVEEAIHFGLAM